MTPVVDIIDFRVPHSGIIIAFFPPIYESLFLLNSLHWNLGNPVDHVVQVHPLVHVVAGHEVHGADGAVFSTVRPLGSGNILGDLIAYVI